MSIQTNSLLNGFLKPCFVLLAFLVCNTLATDVIQYCPPYNDCYAPGTKSCIIKNYVTVCECNFGYTGTFCEVNEMEGHIQDYLTCAEDFFQIQCGTDRILKIVDAVWGRDDFQESTWANCPYGSPACFGINTAQRLKHLCNHRNSCWGYANKYLLGKQIGCYYTPSYLKISYVCQTEYTTTVCEGQMKYLRCNKNKIIHIIKATYGENKPDSKNECGIIEHNPEHGETPCMADVTQKVRDGTNNNMCMGKETCAPTSTYDSAYIFGADAIRCNQVPKSLKVEYKCVPNPY